MDFIQSIRENPCDVDLYLVYADYLQQQNDPRGQLILLDHMAQQDDQYIQQRTNFFQAHKQNFVGNLEFGAAEYYIQWFMGFIQSVELSHLSIDECYRILRKLVRLPSFQFVQTVEICGKKSILKACTIKHLHHLVISLTTIKNLPAEMKQLTHLTHLKTSVCTHLVNISPIANLTNLTSLDLRLSDVKDISALVNLTKLQKLNLECTKVDDISVLAHLTSLVELNLECTNITDLSPLAELTHLMKLNLSRVNFRDISCLNHLTHLEITK